MRFVPTSLSLVALSCLAQVASATLTINLVAETVTDSAGDPVSVLTGQWILIADTTRNGFNAIGPGGISVNDFVAGDDLVIGSGEFGGGDGFVIPGAINKSMPGLTLSGAWGTGDPLALVWFPTVGVGATAVGASESYGRYTTYDPTTNPAATGEDSSQPWLTPADGADHSLQALTSGTSGIFGTGTVDSAALRADLTTVPEPSVSLFGLLALFAFLRRRR